MTDPIVVISKFDQMVEILRSAIDRGDFPPGARLPSENALSAQYGISRNTVREAISSLVQQGVVTRSQGKGSFVTGRRPASAVPAFAIFLHAHTHVYETQTRALVRAFQKRDVLSLVFDVADFPDEAGVEAALAKALDQNVAGLVVEEALSRSLAELAARTGRALPPVVVLNYDYARKVPAKAVVTDFPAGVSLGTRHLIALGRRRILFLIHRNRHVDPGIPPPAMPGMYGDICRGYAEAMRDAGLAAEAGWFFIDREFRAGESDDRERLKAVLTGPGRPDAVFAFGDSRAKHVIDIAEEAGLRVPRDLAVMGYWNTPWAEMTRVPLTSVSICEDEIADRAAATLLEARETGTGAETIVIPPRLVIRESCGASLT